MSNKNMMHLLLWLALTHAGLMVASVSAGVVPQGSRPNLTLGPPGLNNNSWSKFDIALDLSGYRDSAVSFNFSALMSHNPK